MTAPIVIIGSGLAGYMLAKEFRRHDKTTRLLIITQQPGDFYSKPLLSTALTQHKTADQLALNSAEEMAEQLPAEVQVNTEVLAINPAAKSLTTTRGEQPYHRLVLAVGANKIAPPITGDALDTVASVNNLPEYSVFRQWLAGKERLAIMGAGLVGCEFGNDLVNHGKQVHIIALEQEPLAALVPPVIGKQLRQCLAQQGAQWHMQRRVLGVTKSSRKRVTVHIEHADPIEVDGVFSAIGLRPNVTLAQQAGLAVNRGIQVDAFLQTSDPHIYALGDCAEVTGHVLMYVAPILQCARALAATLQGQPTAVHYPVMPVVVKTPSCPIACVPLASQIIGSWTLEGEEPHLAALFHDQQQQLKAFALSGDRVKQRSAMAKQMPALIASTT